MASSRIDPQLLHRLYAIIAAFSQTGYSSPMPMQKIIPSPIEEKEDDDKGEAGGGRGTMKGLRGKDAEFVKRARSLKR